MLTDVIAALATPPGRSAIAMVRLSGRAAHETAQRILDPFTLDPPKTVRRARIVHPRTGEAIDDALYAVFHGPRSYTGEDLVEITIHGGLIVPSETLGALLAAGARPAEPGEFTRRAVMNGKMDLLQAEAVVDLIEASAPAQRRAALAQLDRGLSDAINGLRSAIVELEAMVGYDIDFPEEDEGPVPPARIDAAAADVESRLSDLAATASDGERLREGAVVVIAGPPNAGKSSLFNALVGSERAIVTELPGTTRDAIEAPVTCDGFPVRLVDTAGLRTTVDRVERLGVEVSHRYLARADLVVFCAEATRVLEPDERTFLDELTVPSILVRTKADLRNQAPDGGMPVSALGNIGLAELRAAVARRVFRGLHEAIEPDILITRERHRAAVLCARDEIAAFREARGARVEDVVAAVHLRAAVHALEDVIGVVTDEDVLDRLFSSFCVGK